MKNRSYSVTALLTLSLICLSLLPSVGKAQTLSCDGLSFNGGWGGGGFSMALPFRADAFCNNGPGEQVLYRSGDGSMVVTAKNVLHLDGQGLRVEAGGTADCTNFPKQIVITFSQPVANFQVEIYGAKTATDNRGYTVHLSPPLYPEEYYAPGRPMFTGVAFFPGAGITSITISDPFEYDVNDVGYSLDGFWEMFVMNGRWISESRYKQCGCGQPAIERPAVQALSSNWPLINGIDSNWSMQAEVTDDDGLVLRDIRLGQRYLAEKISVPYYTLETKTAQGTVALPKTRGELKPNSTDASMRSRLVNYYVVTDDPDKFVIEATYLIDQIPAGSQSCLHITQRYEFYKMVPGDHCEPTAKVPCTRWKPIVKYQFFGQGGETLKSLNVVQRQHITVDNNPYNTVGLFRDSETTGFVNPVGNFGDIISRRWNPLTDEFEDQIIKDGKDTGQWDNIHITFKGIVDEPGIFDWNTYSFKRPGCPECSHTHWRWSAFSGGEGKGQLLGLVKGSTQDLSFAVTRNKPGEEDPISYRDLLAYPGNILRTWNTSGRNPLQIDKGSAPEDVVYWRSATGYQLSDVFFGYASFFNPTLPNQQLYDGGAGNFAAQHQASANVIASSPALTDTAQDSLSSVLANQLYLDGATTVVPFNAALAGPLPAGYSLYNNLSYEVATEAEASGPYTATFSVPSVGDQTVFDNLRVFHVEQDPYEPDKVIWVDRTILSPDPQAPDFAAKTLNAKANSLGQFVVAALTQPQPPSTAAADIAISISDSSDPVVAYSDLTYTLTVTNNGPQAATGVTLTDSLAPNMAFVSVTAGQGRCAEADSTIVCKLDTLNAGANTTVTVVARPGEGGIPYPAEGKAMTNTASVSSNEVDSNQVNNISTEGTTILPDPNKAPTVALTSPSFGEMFVGPANINITASASDSDGSISKVDFYADEDLIGTGTDAGAGQYSFVWNNVAFGEHSITAVATDNLGKLKASESISIIVNGSAAVSITSPARWAAFNKAANINITASASLSGGSISKTEFYADGSRLGMGTTSGADQYSFTWNNAPTGNHVLTAVATDDSGVTTASNPVNITVNDPPIVSLVNPLGGAVFAAPANIPLTANANDGDGNVRKVDFYANGSLIGSSATVASSQFNLTWGNASAGSYSLTAVATDDSGGTTTSSPINIIVNAPPSVSMTGPASGAQFTPPANITLTANATDSGGSISQVNFYANGSLIGAGTQTGANQYSLTWSNVGIGSYTVTARATDNNGTTTTSGGISITVNSPPAVSLTSPANGSIYAAPASITLNATASDSDGFIGKVEFFRNSVKLGEDATAPYSYTWSNAGAGNYNITAVATDNLGVTTTSSLVSVTVKPSALFITGSTTLNSSDAAIQTRLQSLGYVVTVKTATAAVSTDASGKTVVVISSTITPNNLGTKFRTVAVPVVMWESLSFYDMGMTAKGTTYAGTATSQTQLKISQQTHPLAAGLTGTQTVVTVSGTFAWGKPSTNAAAVATLLSDATKVVIFGYTQGAAMPGLAAPARRVGLFMNDTTAVSFNSNGWTLFDAAISWATSTAP